MATRLYFNTSKASDLPLSRPLNGFWESNVGNIQTTRRMTGTRYGNPAVANTPYGEATNVGNGTNPNDVLWFQGVSDPLAAQTISGNVSGVAIFRESNSLTNATCKVVIYVVNAAGTVVATLYAGGGDSNEYNSVSANTRNIWNGTANISSYTCADGDRIVIEVGTRLATTRTADNVWMYLGDPSLTTDLPAGDGSSNTNTINPWIEFSGNLTFGHTVSPTFTANAILKKEQAASFSIDAVIASGGSTVASSFAVDAVLQRAVSVGTPFDAVLKKEQAASFTADALLLAVRTGSFTVDAVLDGGTVVVPGSFTADAIVKREASANFSAASVLLRQASASFTVDAVLSGGGAGSSTLDAVIKATIQGSFSTNALVLAQPLVSFTADAILFREQNSALTANAVVRKGATGSFTVAALLLSPRPGSLSADAVLAGTRTGTFSQSAVLQRSVAGTFTSDAVVQATRAGSFGIAAYIVPPPFPFTIDAVINSSVLGSFSVNAVLGLATLPDIDGITTIDEIEAVTVIGALAYTDATHYLEATLD